MFRTEVMLATGILIALFGFASIALAQDAKNVKANDACKAGNYEHDYRKKGTPCDGTDESQKCRLNYPCYEFTNGVKSAIGVCVAAQKCQGTFVRVCDEGGCRWDTPGALERLMSPPPPPPPEIPSVPIERFPRTGMLGDELRRMLAGEVTTDFPGAAAPLDPEDAFREMRDELIGLGLPGTRPEQSADRTGLPIDLLQDPAFTLTGDAPLIPREEIHTLNRELGFSERPIPGSTFADADGPPVPLQQLTAEEIEAQRLQRQYPTFLDAWTRLGEERTAELIRRWDELGIKHSWTMPTIPAEHLNDPPVVGVVRQYDSISDVVTDAVRALFGFEPLAQPQPIFDTPPGISADELARLDRDSAAMVSMGYFVPDEPDLFGRYMYSKINDPGHLDLIEFDQYGRAISIAEPGDGPSWPINSETGKDLLESLYGCTGQCLADAWRDAEIVHYERCGEGDCIDREPPPVVVVKEDEVPAPSKVFPPTPAAPAAPTAPATPMTPPRAPPTTPSPVVPPAGPPSIPPISTPASMPGGGGGLPSFPSLISGLMQLISSLMNWLQGTPPATPMPPAVPPPAAQLPIAAGLVIAPGDVAAGERTRIFWSTTATICTVYQGDVVLFEGSPSGSATSRPVFTPTTIRLFCSRGADTAIRDGRVGVKVDF